MLGASLGILGEFRRTILVIRARNTGKIRLKKSKTRAKSAGNAGKITGNTSLNSRKHWTELAGQAGKMAGHAG